MLHSDANIRDISRIASEKTGYVPLLRDATRDRISRAVSEAETIKIGALKKALIEATGPGRAFSRRGLSLAAGMSADGVRDILSGKSKRPTVETIARLAEQIGKPMSDFVAEADSRSADAPVRVPVIGTVEAGVWREARTAPNGLREIVSPPLARAPRAKRFALRVEGYSMDQVFQPGDYLDCVETIGNAIQPMVGDYVVVERIQGDLHETTVKLFYERSSEGNFLRPLSTRPEFQETIALGLPDGDHFGDDETRVIGIVVGSYRPAENIGRFA